MARRMASRTLMRTPSTWASRDFETSATAILRSKESMSMLLLLLLHLHLHLHLHRPQSPLLLLLMSMEWT